MEKKDNQKHIIVVDDDEIVRKVLGNLLLKNNFVVRTAEDGISLFNFLNNFQTDLILLDINLSWIDGFSLLSKLKAEDSKYKDIPVIIISGKTDTDDINYGYSLGASHYITKPFLEKEILTAINNLI